MPVDGRLVQNNYDSAQFTRLFTILIEKAL